MSKKLKFWTSLGAAALSGAVAAGAVTVDHNVKGPSAKASGYLQLADAGEGGEAGESGGGSSGDADYRVHYFADLGLVEGHMRVGVELQKRGAHAAALTHMKHPADELYEDLKMHFEDVGVPGFADELEAVAKAVEANADATEIDARMSALLAAIAASHGGSMTSAETARTIVELVRTAAEEYVAGIKDGKVTDPHEYQDAWGFVETAKAYLAAVPADEREEHAGPLGEIDAELGKLSAAWPDLEGAVAITADPSLLPGVAARIELAASDIK